MKKAAKKSRSRTVALNEKALSTVKHFNLQLQAVSRDVVAYETLLRHIADDLSVEIDEGLVDVGELNLDEAVRIVGRLERSLYGASTSTGAPRTAEDVQNLIDKLCEYSLTDGLTGLRNRTFFLEVLNREFKRVRRVKEPCSVALIDIDHFKTINDSYGHHAGDFVLRELAQVMMSTIRETDTLTRYGGEEFGLILPDASAKQARILAERMRKRISKEVFAFREINLRITASVGIATYKFDDVVDDQELIERADISLYVAKMEGRNRVCCFTDSTLKKRTQLSPDEKELLVSS